MSVPDIDGAIDDLNDYLSRKAEEVTSKLAEGRRDAATLARIRRIVAASGGHYRGWDIGAIIADALGRPELGCFKCGGDDCEVWGTV